ncbi:MAG: CDP-alcohol phosphatidyltransferase family protein [Nitrososphaerales archaeon]|nr:CDP-alcohol phosphatidyltransferase family protein [Nitrososphaerales archaeon]
MLDSLRSRLNEYFLAVGRAFGATGLPPTAWTFVGLIFSFAAAGAYWSSGYVGELVGGLLLLLSGFFDVVDGAVARATSRVSKRGAFMDSTLDRVAEVAVFAGIMLGRLATPPAVLLALSLSLLVSYTRAKADSLGISLSGVGVGERSERLLALSVFSIVGLASYGVLVVLVLAGLTFLERVSKVSRALTGSAQAPS